MSTNGTATVESTESTDPVATVELSPLDQLVAEILGKSKSGTFATTREAFLTDVVALVDPTTTWKVSSETAALASKEAALIETRLRLHFLNWKGEPDLAGNSPLWKKYATEVIGETYKSAGLSDAQFKDWKNAVYVQRSKLAITFQVASEYVLGNTVNASSATVKVDGDDVRMDKLLGTGLVSGVKSPAIVRNAVKKVYAAQVDTKGKRLPGFEDKRVPTVYGTPATVDQASGDDVETGQFESKFLALIKPLAENITADQAAEYLWILASAAVDGAIGKPKANPTNKSLRKNVPTALPKLRATADLLRTYADFLDSKVGNVTKEQVTEYRHQG